VKKKGMNTDCSEVQLDNQIWGKFEQIEIDNDSTE
jgi:hypothetical protein